MQKLILIIFIFSSLFIGCGNIVKQDISLKSVTEPMKPKIEVSKPKSQLEIEKERLFDLVTWNTDQEVKIWWLKNFIEIYPASIFVPQAKLWIAIYSHILSREPERELWMNGYLNMAFAIDQVIDDVKKTQKIREDCFFGKELPTLLNKYGPSEKIAHLMTVVIVSKKDCFVGAFFREIENEEMAISLYNDVLQISLDIERAIREAKPGEAKFLEQAKIYVNDVIRNHVGRFYSHEKSVYLVNYPIAYALAYRWLWFDKYAGNFSDLKKILKEYPNSGWPAEFAKDELKKQKSKNK